MDTYLNPTRYISKYCSPEQLRPNLSLFREIPDQNLAIFPFLDDLHDEESPLLPDVIFADKKISSNRTRERALLSAYFVDKHFEGGAIYSFLNTLKRAISLNRIVLIRGQAGIGKSTLVRRAFQLANTDSRIASQFSGTFFAVIDAIRNKRPYEDLEQHIASHMSLILNGILTEYNMTKEDLFKDELSQYHNILKNHLRGFSEEKARREVMEIIVSRGEYVKTSNDKILRLIQKTMKGHLVLFIDNIDKYPPSQVNDFARNLLPMLRYKCITPVISLRHSTDERLKKNDVLDQYRNVEVYHLRRPRLQDVLRKRLLFDSSGNRVDVSIGEGFTYEDLYEKLLHNYYHLHYLCHTDTRRFLLMIETLLYSPHFSSIEHFTDLDRIIRALMCGHHHYSYSSSSIVMNPFQNNSSDGYQNTLIRIRLLQYLKSKDEVWLSTDPIFTIFERLGYAANTLKKLINTLVYHGAIQVAPAESDSEIYISNNGNLDLEEGVDTISLSPTGELYHMVLLKNSEFLRICIEGATLPKKYLRKIDGVPIYQILEKYFKENVDESEGDFIEQNITPKGELFITKDSFIDYLEDAESQELESWKSSPGNPPIRNLREVMPSIAEFLRRTYL